MIDAHVTAVYIRRLPHIILSPLQMDTVTKILIKMRPLNAPLGAILILVIIYFTYKVKLKPDKCSPSFWCEFLCEPGDYSYHGNLSYIPRVYI